MTTLRELSADLLTGKVAIEAAGPMAPRGRAAPERSLMAKGVFTAAANPTPEG